LTEKKKCNKEISFISPHFGRCQSFETSVNGCCVFVLFAVVVLVVVVDVVDVVLLLLLFDCPKEFGT